MKNSNSKLKRTHIFSITDWQGTRKQDRSLFTSERMRKLLEIKEYYNSASHEICEIIDNRISSLNIIPYTQSVSSYLDKLCNEKATQKCKSGGQTTYYIQNDWNDAKSFKIRLLTSSV